jgi:hypothetical protein
MKKHQSLFIAIIVAVIALVGISWTIVGPKESELTQTDAVVVAMTELVSAKYNIDTSTVILTVKHNTGEHATGALRFSNESGGGLWFGVKQEENWKLAYDGNGIVPCNIAEEYAFPTSIVPQCIDTSNENQLTTR